MSRHNPYNLFHGIRYLVALVGAIAVTLAFCLLAPVLGGKGANTLPEPIRPVRLTALSQEKKMVEKRVVQPRKDIQLPAPQKNPAKTVEKVEKIKIALQPLKVEMPQLEVATLAVPVPSPVKNVTSGLGHEVHQLTEVDTPPRLQRYTPPPYPAQAKGQGVTGRVVVRCVVSANGTVQEAQIIEAEPAGYFEKVSLKTVKTWKFTPAAFKGEKVACYVDIPLSFTLND